MNTTDVFTEEMKCLEHSLEGVHITCDLTQEAAVAAFEPPAPAVHPLKQLHFEAPIFKRLKTAQLKQFVKQYAGRAKQGSAEWLADRKAYIGGSEIASVIGKNPYSSYISWLRQKLELSARGTNVAMLFGKLFENVAVCMMEMVFSTKVYELGAIDGCMDCIRYSPDGLAVAELVCEDAPEGEMIRTLEYLKVMFEFKSPLSTIPNGVIPPQYIPQVMTGLCSMPVDTGIFVNNMFRKCSLDELADPLAYDKKFHDKDAQRCPDTGLPVAMGIVYVFSQQQQGITDVIDYGQVGAPFPRLLYMLNESKVEIDFEAADVVITPEFDKIEFIAAQLEARAEWNNEHKMPPSPSSFARGTIPRAVGARATRLAKGRSFVGFVPWKLFKSDIIVVEKDPQYLDEYKGMLTHVGALLKKATAMTKAERQELFNAEVERMCI